MNKARTNIIERLKFVTAENSVAPVSPSEAPEWSKKEQLRRFKERLESVRAEVIEVAPEDLATALATRAGENGIEALLYDPASKWGGIIGDSAGSVENFPRLLAYDREIEHWKETLFYHVDAAITTTQGGIAETGSLILWPTETEPRSMSLVPPIHFAIVEVDEVFSTLAEAMARQCWAERMPTNLLLVSGPSKSADIEQTLAYGVHGPKALIVLLVQQPD